MNKNLFIVIFILVIAVTESFGTDYIHYRLGRTYKDQGEYELARDELQKVISVYPDHYNAYFQLAEISSIEGNSAMAESYYKKALQYNPGWRSAYHNLAQIFEEQGRYEESIQMLQQAQRGATEEELQSISDDLRRVSGRQQEISDSLNPEVTEQASHSAVTAQPVTYNPLSTPSADARMELDKAIRSYQEVSRTGSTNYETAITHIRRALALNPGYPLAYYYGGLIRRKKGQADMAKVNFLKAIPDPDLGYNAHFYLGKIYGEADEYLKAIEQYELYRSKTDYEPGRRDALNMIRQYQALLEQRAGDTVNIAEINRIEIEQELRSLPEQFEISELQIRISPLLTMVIADTALLEGQAMLKAVYGFRESRYDDAINEFHKVLGQYPQGDVAAMTIYDLGICRMKLHDWNGAITKFGQYRERFPDGELASNALFLQAVANFEMKKNDLAERLFQNYIRENRGGEWVGKSYEKLGDIYATADEQRRAIDAYDLAVDNSSVAEDSIFSAFKRAEAYVTLDNWSGALSSFELVIATGEANSIYTRVPDSYYRIADHTYREKKYEESRDRYQRVTRLYPSYQDTPWGLFQLGNIAKNEERYDEAIAAFDTLIARFPEDYWASQAEWKRKDAVWQYQYGSPE